MPELWSILVPLLIAHLLTDFALQTNTMVREKSGKNFRSVWLYIHAGIAGITAYVLAAIWNPQMWGYHEIFWVTAITHLFIDGWKNALSDPNRPVFFLLDQAFHYAVIAGLCVWVIGWDSAGGIIRAWPLREAGIIAVGLFFITTPAGITLEITTGNWKKGVGPDDLPDLGYIIGILERIAVYVLVLMQQFTLAGFVVAAIAVFYYGHISQKKQAAGYLLAKTLLSITIAIFTGLIVTMVL